MNEAPLDFDRDVLHRSRSIPVVVDFWAPWCGPCKMLGPVIERLASEADGRWALVKVDTDAQPGLAEAYRIASLPTVKLFRDGAVVDEFSGFLPEAGIRRWLDRHLPSPATLELEKAAELIDDGDLAGARVLIEQSLAADPARAAAKLLLAEILLATDPQRALALLAEIPVEADEASHAQALRLLIEGTLRLDQGLPDHDARPRLEQALQAVRQRDWETALPAFTDVLERAPTYAEGLAADAGKAIFRYLGIRHPTAEKHYRRFSGALNA
ncbi:MAG: thioredoxin [Verrucomicrobiae bacterium]|nr:thioredoxin [Verrucomicrobiae bacterium]